MVLNPSFIAIWLILINNGCNGFGWQKSDVDSGCSQKSYDWMHMALVSPPSLSIRTGMKMRLPSRQIWSDGWFFCRFRVLLSSPQCCFPSFTSTAQSGSPVDACTFDFSVRKLEKKCRAFYTLRLKIFKSWLAFAFYSLQYSKSWWESMQAFADATFHHWFKCQLAFLLSQKKEQTGGFEQLEERRHASFCRSHIPSA